MSSITDLSMLQLAEAIKDKKISACEALDACFDLIDAKEEDLNSFAVLYYDEAQRAAKSVDDAIVSGKDIGILAGVPYAIKDNIFYNGQTATAASKSLKNFTPAYDAEVVSLLKNTGAICIGRTNMDELAMGSSTVTSCYDKTVNPHALTASPGGSSGGSAAAVAAKEAFFALGSDTGGSIRQPASFCGIVGYKPTKDLVNNSGIIPLAPSFDQVGTLTKDVMDCAALLDILTAGKTRALAGLSELVKGHRFAIVREYMQDVSSDVMQNFDKVLQFYLQSGAIVEEISIPDSAKSLQAYHVLGPIEIADLPSWLHDNAGAVFHIDRLGDEAKRRIVMGNYLKENGASYITAAKSIQNKLSNEFNEIFKRFDALLTPCTRQTAFDFNDMPADNVEMYKNDLLLAGVNLCGLPAISIPSGMAHNKPTSFQLIGAANNDAKLLSIADNYFKTQNLM